MPVIGVLNQKGGVGKTTTALNLSAAITLKNASSILIDLDPQCHLTKIHKEYPEEVAETLYEFYAKKKSLDKLAIDWPNVGKLIPSHQELIKVETKYGNGPEILFKLKRGLESLKEASPHDFIILDCPANTGVLSLSAIFAADLIIIPIVSDHFSLKAAKRIEFVLQALERVLKKRVPRCYLNTRYDKRRNISSELYEKAREEFGSELLDTIIYENVSLAVSPKENMDIFSYRKKSIGSESYQALLNELLSKGLIEIT